MTSSAALPRIIITGGTFDKAYLPGDGSLGFDISRVPALLTRAGVVCPCTELMLIDSLDMLDSHRAQIAAACREADEMKLVITHGTDTMTDTARYLATLFAELPTGRASNKTIVLTGAMVPASIKGSDALFNLGHAIGAAGLLQPGVWICMNGQTFAWDRARKNRSAGRFEPIDG